MKKSEDNIDQTKSKKDTSSKESWLIKGGLAALVFLLLGVGYYGYLYSSTPSHLRNPEFEHYHLRTQIVIDGEPVDFSREEFQEDYDKNSCSAELTGQPIDFHDGVDQMVHVHWRDITGGEFLKFYGWNLIGGQDDSLGRRFDQGILDIPRIDIAGDLLPDAPEGSTFYIYTGDESTYEQKNWQDFLYTDMEQFLGKESLLTNEETSLFNPLNWFMQKVNAHGSVDDGHQDESEEERLTRINNLIGNIVIFVQDSAPSDEQIKNRFNSLVPLTDSVCGG